MRGVRDEKECSSLVIIDILGFQMGFNDVCHDLGEF